MKFNEKKDENSISHYLLSKQIRCLLLLRVKLFFDKTDFIVNDIIKESTFRSVGV